MFVGLVAGGLLAAIDWRWVFWVNVPVGAYGTLWAYLRLRDNGERHRARIEWWGNVTFAVGLSAVLVAVTHGSAWPRLPRCPVAPAAPLAPVAPVTPPSRQPRARDAPRPPARTSPIPLAPSASSRFNGWNPLPGR